MEVHVIVQNDRDYTNSGCRNIGVHGTLHSAKLSAWLSLVDSVSKPWKLAFYKKPKQSACGVPDVYIEAWSSGGTGSTGSMLMATYRLGWGIEGNTHKSQIDQHLKSIGADLEQTLLQWKEELQAGRLPPALDEFIVGVPPTTPYQV